MDIPEEDALCGARALELDTGINTSDGQPLLISG